MYRTENRKIDFSRLSILLLTGIMLLSALPGTMTAAVNDAPPEIESFADLKELCEQRRVSDSEGSMMAICMTANFRIEEDLTLPSWLHLQFVDLEIPEGITLTISKSDYILITRLYVNGTLINQGSITQSVWGPDRSMVAGVAVRDSGMIENEGKMSLANPILGTKIRGSGTYTVDREVNQDCKTFEDLQAMAMSAAADPAAKYKCRIRTEVLIISSDLTIPENMTLSTGSGNSVVRVEESAELTNLGYINLYSVIDVRGRLVNEGNILIYDTGCRIVIDEEAEYSGRGRLALYGPPEDFFPVEGMDAARFRKTGFYDPVTYQLKGEGEDDPDAVQRVYIRSASELESIVRTAETDPDTFYEVSFLMDEAMVLSSDLTIPERVSVVLFRNTLCIPAEVTVKLIGEIQLQDGQLKVEGILENEGRIITDTDSLIELKTGGKYTGSGDLTVEYAKDDYFPIDGMDSSNFKQSEDGRNVTYRLKKETGEGEAALEYVNFDTGYRALVLDEEDLLNESEKAQLLEDMKPITEFGDIAFWSTGEDADDAVEQAGEKRQELFGRESGTILVVNINLRKVSINSYGRIYERVPENEAKTVTNNISEFLSNQEYYQGAQAAFEQIEILLRERIYSEMGEAA